MSTRTVACKPSLPARQTVDEASSNCAANRYRLLFKKAVMPHDSEAASAVSSGYARTVGLAAYRYCDKGCGASSRNLKLLGLWV